MREIKPTDLIKHFINLTSNIKPIYTSIKRYTLKEKTFAAEIFPEIKKAGIIVRAVSD